MDDRSRLAVYQHDGINAAVTPFFDVLQTFRQSHETPTHVTVCGAVISFRGQHSGNEFVDEGEGSEAHSARLWNGLPALSQN
ncbi:MAG: hypothetical protein IH933_02400 [Euryarchaeota archaeon]|jgi:hypothetical protein|nr:hypothetical protein [Euryarchaeota archaeon]